MIGVVVDPNSLEKFHSPF